MIIRWFVNALALYIVAQIVPGVSLTNFWAALISTLVIGLLNAIIKPILVILTLPINILTLGLFTFVVNALILLLASSFVTGFAINGFVNAIVAAILLTIVSTILQGLIK